MIAVVSEGFIHPVQHGPTNGYGHPQLPVVPIPAAVVMVFDDPEELAFIQRVLCGAPPL